MSMYSTINFVLWNSAKACWTGSNCLAFRPPWKTLTKHNLLDFFWTCSIACSDIELLRLFILEFNSHWGFEQRKLTVLSCLFNWQLKVHQAFNIQINFVGWIAKSIVCYSWKVIKFILRPNRTSQMNSIRISVMIA